ncbi:hypothetical protein IWX47DRAFT_651675 [Phyllosticta citricarpa]
MDASRDCSQRLSTKGGRNRQSRTQQRLGHGVLKHPGVQTRSAFKSGKCFAPVRFSNVVLGIDCGGCAAFDGKCRKIRINEAVRASQSSASPILVASCCYPMMSVRKGVSPLSLRRCGVNSCWQSLESQPTSRSSSPIIGMLQTGKGNKIIAPMVRVGTSATACEGGWMELKELEKRTDDGQEKVEIGNALARMRHAPVRISNF